MHHKNNTVCIHNSPLKSLAISKEKKKWLLCVYVCVCVIWYCILITLLNSINFLKKMYINLSLIHIVNDYIISTHEEFVKLIV